MKLEHMRVGPEQVFPSEEGVYANLYRSGSADLYSWSFFERSRRSVIRLMSAQCGGSIEPRSLPSGCFGLGSR